MKKITNLLLIYIVLFACSISEAMDSKESSGQQARKLYLIAEAHSSTGGVKTCHQMMREKREEEKLNLFIERDAARLEWARKEATLLTCDSEEEFFLNHEEHRKKLNPKVASCIYSMIDSTKSESEREGRIRNRFWFLQILKEFGNSPTINIIPCDASIKEVIHYIKTKQNIKGLGLLRIHIELIEETPDDCQNSVNEVMKDSHSLKPRNLKITASLNQKTEVDTINIALLGLVHAGWVYDYLSRDIQITPFKTSFPPDDLERERSQPGVEEFLKNATK